MYPYLSEFLTIATVHLLAVASPGPDFAVVVRQSIAGGKRSGIFTSIGIGLGVLVHVAYCLVGLGLIISKSIFLFNLIKYLGAAYLVYVGLTAIFSRSESTNEPAKVKAKAVPSDKKALALGFFTNALNPKATIFFLALFSVVIDPGTPLHIQLAYGAWMVVVSALWFCLLTILLSSKRVRTTFEKLGHWFEKIMGGLLVALGAKLALAEIR